MLTALLRWLTARLTHHRPDTDLAAEMQAHTEQLEEELAARGISRDQAKRQARLRLGDPHSAIEQVRDHEFATFAESLFRDVSFGLRNLRRNPLSSLIAILTLAIGIGANTTIFSLLHGLFFRSLPVSAPGDLVAIGLEDSRLPPGMLAIPYRMLDHLRRQDSALAGLSAWNLTTVVIEDRDGTLRLNQAALVGGNAFRLLGMEAHAGRMIAESDDVPGGTAAGWSAVLSYGYWIDRFGGDPAVIGKTLPVQGLAVTVVGVAPRRFQGVWTGENPALYLPLHAIDSIAGRAILQAPDSFLLLGAIGRLKQGASLEQFHAELAVHQQALLTEFMPKSAPGQDQRSVRLRAASARTGLPTFAGRDLPLLLMQGLVAIVLLLCCVNVSGMMLAKMEHRQREFAIRTAIGAGKWRLLRQYLTETFVIAAIGATLGGAAGWRGVGFIASFFRDPNRVSGVTIEPDRTALLITGALAVFATLLAGVVPAWRAGRADPGSLITARGVFGGRGRAGRAFVPVQVALSLVLVVLAGLLSQSLQRLRSEPTGFDLDHVTIQTPPLHRLGLKPEAKLDLYQRMVDHIERSASVRAAAVTWYTPMTGRQATAEFQGAAPGSAALAYNDVGPRYFRTMNIRVSAGREFTRNERSRDLCMLNSAAAARLFPGSMALDASVPRIPRRRPRLVACKVIGIVQDAKFAKLQDPPPPTVYFPVSPATARGNLVFLINAATKAEAMAAYREALRANAPSIPIVLFATLREQMDAVLGSERVLAMLCNTFGALALLLSAIGLYGLLSTSVARRSGEIGVRMALGATRGSVTRMVVADALRLAATGAAAGLVALAVVLRWVRSLLYGVSAFDPMTLIGSALVLGLVALLAASLPAMRAAAIDPARALRAE
ncbi:MAG: ADOP family duplicated permease [Bryobacteraceae bacterium]